MKGLNDVFKELDKFERRMINAGEAGASLTAVEMANYAKKNRNWKDRTNVARNSLTGSSERSGNTIRTALAMGVFYGVYLELSNAGRYAIIQRTVDAHRQKFQDNVKKLARI